MSGEEEDVHLPGNQTPVTTVLVTTIPRVPSPESGRIMEPHHRSPLEDGRIPMPLQDQQVPAPDRGPVPGEPPPAPGLPKIILKGLLNTRFNGTPVKLVFFVVQVAKFLNAWDHLFPSEVRMVDYTISYRVGQLTGMGPSRKVKGPKPKTSTRELHMKKGLCLRCGKAGHYAAACPRMGEGPALAKDSWEKKPDTPLKK
ncbi:UNVERIFIED_CONTAM: hypothetical protein K2H54_006769 [Gekko kuhli]